MKNKMNQNNHENKSSEIVKKFTFRSKDGTDHYEVDIIEIMGGVYSYYVWPAAKVLAQFIFYMRRCMKNINLLEIGCGTSLPGILSQKLGANVILSDSAILSKSLSHIKRICAYNNLIVDVDIQVKGLTWGMIGNGFFEVGTDLDLIIGSDVLYDSSVFEDVLSTVSFLLERNPKSTFVCSYQMRSSDWSLENLLKKWNLKCRNIDLEEIGKENCIDMKDLMEGHSIYLLEFYRIS